MSIPVCIVLYALPTTSLHGYTVRCGSTRDLLIHDIRCPGDIQLHFCPPVSYVFDLLRLWLSERIRSKWLACALTPGWLLRIDTRLRVSTRSLTIELESSGYRLSLLSRGCKQHIRKQYSQPNQSNERFSWNPWMLAGSECQWSLWFSHIYVFRSCICPPPPHSCICNKPREISGL